MAARITMNVCPVRQAKRPIPTAVAAET
jgi:hypothetical protein